MSHRAKPDLQTSVQPGMDRADRSTHVFHGFGQNREPEEMRRAAWYRARRIIARAPQVVISAAHTLAHEDRTTRGPRRIFIIRMQRNKK